MWFFMPKLRVAPSSLGFSLLTDQGWAGTGAFLTMLLFIYKVGTLNPSNQWTVALGFVFQQEQNIFQLSPCIAVEGKWLQRVVTPPWTASAATLSTSNSSTSQVDIIRNPRVNNLIISSAQRLVCRRSDSRKSAAQIRAGKMPDFKKETGRDPEERERESFLILRWWHILGHQFCSECFQYSHLVPLNLPFTALIIMFDYWFCPINK